MQVSIYQEAKLGLFITFFLYLIISVLLTFSLSLSLDYSVNLVTHAISPKIGLSQNITVVKDSPQITHTMDHTTTTGLERAIGS